MQNSKSNYQSKLKLKHEAEFGISVQPIVEQSRCAATSCYGVAALLLIWQGL